MSTRGPSTRGKRARLAAAEFPTLESFFSGYLHEDYVEEHGTPGGALRACRADLDEDERVRLESEAGRLLQAAADRPFDEVREFIRRELSSAWIPRSLVDLQGLFGPSPKRPTARHHR